MYLYFYIRPNRPNRTTTMKVFSRALLERLPLEQNSNDYAFDNQMLAQVLWFGYTIAEVSCPTRYAPEVSSIGFSRSVVYGLSCLGIAIRFRLARMGALHTPLFPRDA